MAINFVQYKLIDHNQSYTGINDLVPIDDKSLPDDCSVYLTHPLYETFRCPTKKKYDP